jgi:hypothetical protein
MGDIDTNNHRLALGDHSKLGRVKLMIHPT